MFYAELLHASTVQIWLLNLMILSGWASFATTSDTFPCILFYLVGRVQVRLSKESYTWK